MKKILYLIFPLTGNILFAQPGTLDNSFNPGLGADTRVYCTSSQPDNKVILVGVFTNYYGSTRNYLARANADASVDFFNPGVSTNITIFVSELQNDGKILIGGSFNSYQSVSRNGIARVTAIAQLDTTFNPGTGVTGASDNYINSIVVQPDGRIILGGEFNYYNGITRKNITRVNIDGSIDTTFNPGIGIGGNVAGLALQPDGKIVAVGHITSYNANSAHHIVRINSDGAFDSSFNTSIGANSKINAVAIQSDGKIIIGGTFTTFNTTPINRIARLNSDGSLDTSFNVGSGADTTITSISIQNNGKIIVGGFFNSFSGIPRKGIVRLNSNGTMDTVFNQGSGTNDFVFSTKIQNDGKIVIAGDFTTYNSISRRRIARLIGDNPTNITENNNSNNVSINPNPFTNEIKIKGDKTFFSLYDFSGKLLLHQTTTSAEAVLKTESLAAGLYFLRVEDEERVRNYKVVKQ
jgi:uncharacterized delta-60 repeat protein